MSSELSERLLDHIQKYVKHEDLDDPRCDAEILSFVHKLGYEWMTMFDVTRARIELKIKPYEQRKWKGEYFFRGQ